MYVEGVYLRTSLLSRPERLYLRSVTSVPVHVTLDFIGPPTTMLCWECKNYEIMHTLATVLFR